MYYIAALMVTIIDVLAVLFVTPAMLVMWCHMYLSTWKDTLQEQGERSDPCSLEGGEETEDVDDTDDKG